MRVVCLCIFYVNLLVNVFCGVKNTRVWETRQRPEPLSGKVVGGIPVNIKEFPFAVKVFNMGNMCAGTIINSWTVLTAAHCFDINKDPAEITVHVGSRYSYDFAAKMYTLYWLVTHEKYNKTGLFVCDIALMFLEDPIQFDETARKAVLVNNARWMSAKERNFTVTGWGWTKYGGPVSELGLLKTYMRFIPIKLCSELHKIKFSADMFCLYGEGVRDTCKGDSGGGVLWHDMIVGITSHGDGCAKKNSPSVYVNVLYFRSWIEKQVRKFLVDYCNNTIIKETLL